MQADHQRPDQAGLLSRRRMTEQARQADRGQPRPRQRLIHHVQRQLRHILRPQRDVADEGINQADGKDDAHPFQARNVFARLIQTPSILLD